MPSNQAYNGIVTTGLDLPFKTRWNSTFQYTSMRQNDPFMPFTINPGINRLGTFRQPRRAAGIEPERRSQYASVQHQCDHAVDAGMAHHAPLPVLRQRQPDARTADAELCGRRLLGDRSRDRRCPAGAVDGLHQAERQRGIPMAPRQMGDARQQLRLGAVGPHPPRRQRHQRIHRSRHRGLQDATTWRRCEPARSIRSGATTITTAWRWREILTTPPPTTAPAP